MTIAALANEGTPPTIAGGDAEIHLRQNVPDVGGVDQPLQFVRVDNNFELLRLKANESALVINSNETDIGTNTTAIATNATAIALNTTHRGVSSGNPHSVTKTEVGLGSADNTSDADKPVSTATASALALKATIASPTFTGTVAGITSTMVGLGNVANVAAIPASDLIDEDTMTSNSATKVPSQQSVKAYVDVSVVTAATTARIHSGNMALTDNGSYVLCTHGTGILVTLPQDSDLAFPVGANIVFERNGAGTLTFAAGSGATVNSKGGVLTCADRYTTVAAVKIAADTWTIFGNIG